MVLVLTSVTGGCDRHEPAPNAEKARSAVTALGRVTPGRAVISIAAQPGSRLLELKVVEGRRVRGGEVLAYLEGHPLRVAEQDAARIALEEARERLETESVHARAMIAQAGHAVALLEVAAEHARKELRRSKAMKAALSTQNIDEREFEVRRKELELLEAKAALAAAEAALARVPTLVSVRSAEARLKTAEAQLELTIVRAPGNGEILRIFTYPGERIGNDPILKMGDTADMHVIAEVHETDIGLVRVGQRATITSQALRRPLEGVVEEIGSLIHRNDVFDLDPRAARDTRVVEVRVKLAESAAVSRLTHLEVSTRIDLGAPGRVRAAAR